MVNSTTQSRKNREVYLLIVSHCGLGRGFQALELNSRGSPSAFRRGANGEPEGLIANCDRLSRST